MLELKDVLDIPVPILTNIFGFTFTVIGTFFAVFKFIMIKIDKEIAQLRLEFQNSVKRDDILPRMSAIEEQMHNISIMLIIIVSNLNGVKNESDS